MPGTEKESKLQLGDFCLPAAPMIRVAAWWGGNWDLGGSRSCFGRAKSSSLRTEHFLPFLSSEPVPTQSHFLFVPPPYFKAVAEQFPFFFFFPDIISATLESCVNTQCHKDVHNVTLTGCKFPFSDERGLDTSSTEYVVTGPSNLEALSVKVAYKCEIVHAPRDG